MPPKRKPTKKAKAAEVEAVQEPDSTVVVKPAPEKEEEAEEEEVKAAVEVEEEATAPKRGRRAAAAKKENGTKEEKEKKPEKKGTKRGAKAKEAKIAAAEEEPQQEEEEKVDKEETAATEEPYEPKKRRAATKTTEKPETNGKTKASKAQTDAPTGDADNSFNCTKKNAEGNLPNLKIASWNVAGLRAWLGKDGLTYVKNEDPDIFCMQETKCHEDALPEDVKDLSGYKKYWANSEKKGQAGVSLFSKVEPLSVKIGIDHDLDEEGRCITAEYPKFYLVAVYVPNAGRKLVTLDKRLKWNDAFKSYIEGLDKKKPVIICGDMNVAHNEIDLANPKTNKKNAGFTKEERDGMTDFLGSGFVDTYRKLYPEEVQYTFWTYMANARAKNVGWRLDYFLVSERMMDKVCDTSIRTKVLGSDHCPIILHINV